MPFGQQRHESAAQQVLLLLQFSHQDNAGTCDSPLTCKRRIIDEPVTRRLASAVVLALTLLWLGSVLVHLPQGQAVVSVSWAVVGIGLFVVGATRKHRDAAAAGLAVIGLTVGKLLTVDLREVDALWRAGLFLVVGLGLLRLGFLLPSWTDDDEARQ